MNFSSYSSRRIHVIFSICLWHTPWSISRRNLSYCSFCLPYLPLDWLSWYTAKNVDSFDVNSACLCLKKHSSSSRSSIKSYLSSVSYRTVATPANFLTSSKSMGVSAMIYSVAYLISDASMMSHYWDTPSISLFAATFVSFLDSNSLIWSQSISMTSEVESF